MLLRSSAKVGAVVLLALALGFVLYSQLAHLKTNSYTVKLNVPDTQGLSAQSVVRMEGVAVGEVSSVDLDADNKPLIYLAIKKKYRIPSDYVFKITSGILITQAQVQIVPPAKRASVPAGFIATDNTAIVTNAAHAPVSLLDTVDPELHETFVRLNRTFTTITERFNDAANKTDIVLQQTQRLMDTVNKIAGSTNGVISDPSLKKNLLTSLENVRLSTDDAHAITTQMRHDMDDLFGSSKGALKDLGTKVNTLLDHLDDTVQGANTVVEKLTEQVTDPHLQQSLQETTDLARQTLARFNQIASDIHSITGDPSLQGDIKRTFATLGDAAQHGKDAMEKVDTILGKFSNSTNRAPKIPRINIIANVSEQVTPTRNRIDLDAQIPFGRNSLLDIGLFDVGQSTGFNLQAGNYLNKNVDIRYGLHDSKIGAGIDYWAQKGTGITADLFNTDVLRLDVRGLYRVNNNASLWIGGDNVTRTPIPLIGIQLTN